jgi:hypothetical protein
LLRDRRSRFAAEFHHARQGILGEPEPNADRRHRLLEAGETGKPRPQRDAEPAIEAETGIGRRLRAGAELTLQLVELPAHLDERLHCCLRTSAKAAYGHINLTASPACRAFP